ncbi:MULTISPECIES: hypothetical protein [unclassified Streptomyces]|uniref:hypothetical protein n=1 Tax=unclassified Streptomyces TaxID=2593676 RepID=UPI000A682FE2|nr:MULTISPECIES: hypothetical protein [unclassified Streptomyces]
MTSRRVRAWAGAVLGGLGLIALGVFFVRSGLESADRLASVIGVFVGIAGLALAAYGTVQTRRTPSGPPAGHHGDVTNVVRDATVEGSVRQARDATAGRGSHGRAPHAGGVSNSVENSTVRGDLTQSRDTFGDAPPPVGGRTDE